MAAQQPSSSVPLLDSGDAEGTLADLPDFEFADILHPNALKTLDDFRTDLRRCHSDADRFQLCTEARSNLLQQHTETKLLAAAFDHVMFVECERYKEYKENKACRLRNGKRTDENDEEEWDRCVGVAASGSRMVSERLAPLKIVSRCWGRDKVQHYKWAMRATKTCKALCSGANQNPHWEKDARPKLQQLQLRRIMNPLELHRRLRLER